MEAMEEMERVNTLQYMLMVYLGEKRWSQGRRVVRKGEIQPRAPRGGSSAGSTIGAERRRRPR
jgi:hypothetical protein